MLPENPDACARMLPENPDAYPDASIRASRKKKTCMVPFRKREKFFNFAFRFVEILTQISRASARKCFLILHSNLRKSLLRTRARARENFFDFTSQIQGNPRSKARVRARATLNNPSPVVPPVITQLAGLQCESSTKRRLPWTITFLFRHSF